MPEIKFRVSGGDLEAHFAKIKQNSASLANSLIADAQKENQAAKGQIKLIEDQIALLEKKGRLTSQINSLTNNVNRTDRVDNIGNRDSLIAYLRKSNNEKYQAKEITREDFLDRNKRIGVLSTRNTEGSINADSKEYTKRQIDSFKEQQLQTKLLRDNVNSVKEGAANNVKAIKQGDKNLEEILEEAKGDPAKMLSANLAKEELEGKKPKSDNEIMKLVAAAFGVSTLTGIIGGFGRLAQTKSGFDMIANAEETTGKIVGATVGAVVGAIAGSLVPGLGTAAGIAAGAASGSSIGEGLGSVKGGIDQRIIQAQMSYLDLQNRYMATTGGGLGSTSMRDLSAFGISKADILSSSREYARLSGSSVNARSLAEQSYFAEKGYGVDRGTSNTLIDVQRSTNRDSIEIANIVGGVLEKGKNTFFKGGDQTFLNEFLGKYTTLTKELLKSSNTVASGTTYDILSKFGGLGGQFDSKDPRSMGLISTINSSLTSGGGNDYAKAGNFLALKQANPEMDLVDLLMEEQKGLGSKNYLSSVLKQIKGAGGGRSQQIMNIANRLGLSGNLAAAESVYNNQDSLINGTMSMADIRTNTDLSGKAKGFTTPEQENTAKVSNSLISDWKTATDTMATAFKDAMQTAILGIKVVKNNNGDYYLSYDPAKARGARTAKEASSKSASEKTGNRLMHLDH